jgi:hypothetical protein
MRTLLIATVTVLLAGCATAATTGNRIAVTDQKSNMTRYADRAGTGDFVGTSAGTTQSAKTVPSWYRFGHP